MAQEPIPWLNNYTSDITMGSNTCSYTFKTIDGNACKLSIEEKKTDKKGAATTMTYQFYLSDLNTSAMNFKTSGSVAVVNLAIKQSQKFIKVFKNGELQGYDSDIAINMSEIDKARSFIDAMKANVDKCQSSQRTWSSRNDALKWMAENIGKSEASGTIYNQTFTPGEKSYMVALATAITDPKGVKQDIAYEFNLNDINSAKINMAVSGKVFMIELPVRENNNFIRLKKGTGEISFIKEVALYTDDMEQARNLLNGLVYLVNETPAPERKKWSSYSSALGFVNENVGDIKAGTVTTGQSFTSASSPSGMVTFTTKKTDSKNVTTQTDQSFYLNDLQPTVTVEATTKGISVNLVTKDKLKYIKESSPNGILPYSSSVEIAETDLDKARELANALQYAIEKSEKGVIEFSSLDKSIDWITANVGEVKVDAEKIVQTVTVNKDNENKIEFNCATTGSSGTAINERFEIYPEEIKLESTKIKISGKKLTVILSTGKQKYVKYYKDNVLQPFIADTEVAFDDVVKARNFIAAITLLRDKSQVADRSFKNKSTALDYISEHVKKIEVAGVTVDQKIEQRDNNDCKAKFTRIETNSKGVSVENIYEFTLSDIDPAGSTIVASSKNLTINLVAKNKEKLIKPYKNGEAGNFIANIEIDVEDVMVAKRLHAAFASLVGFCK
jgi:hypothetical protein